ARGVQPLPVASGRVAAGERPRPRLQRRDHAPGEPSLVRGARALRRRGGGAGGSRAHALQPRRSRAARDRDRHARRGDLRGRVTRDQPTGVPSRCGLASRATRIARATSTGSRRSGRGRAVVLRRVLSACFWAFLVVSSLLLFPVALLIWAVTVLFDRRL